jgi:hypothetical protein
VLVLVCLGALLGPSACGWVSVHNRVSKPDGFNLHGYVSVAGAAAGSPGTACLARSGSVASGVAVKIVDEDGVQLAAGSLGEGVLAGAGSAWQCNFPFDLSNVPGAPDAVVVEVGQLPAAHFATSELREGRAAVIPVAAATASSSAS